MGGSGTAAVEIGWGWGEIANGRKLHSLAYESFWVVYASVCTIIRFHGYSSTHIQLVVLRLMDRRSGALTASGGFGGKNPDLSRVWSGLNFAGIGINGPIPNATDIQVTIRLLLQSHTKPCYRIR